VTSTPWRKDVAVEPGYRIDGPADAPVVILGPSLGTQLSMFDRQVAALAETLRVVRFDIRGHGSSAPSSAAFTLADMAADVVALADRLGIARFSYVGVSISGAIGQALAIDYPDRLDRLVINASAAHWPDHDEWVARAARVRAEGLGFFVPSRTGIWFSEAFARAFPGEAEALLTNLAATDKHGYAACCEAIGDFDARARLGEIGAPTLVIAGERDVATPVARAMEIHAGIAGSELAVVPEALHLLNIEQSEAFNTLVLRHLHG
jgi:3-oxoadipate enol-lactonase